MTPDGDIGVATCLASVGQRIKCDDHYATVRYVGEVPPSKGLWLGVEWDDPSRGRHNGVHSGIEYFKTRHPTAGSFVRPAKVCFGRTFSAELKDRYGIVEGLTAGVDERVLKDVQKTMNAPFVELVGFGKVNKKQSCFESLQIVSLQGYNVSSAGAEGEIAAVCPSIENLNLSLTLINNWSTIAKITSQLQNLQCLNISHNRLQVPENNEACDLRDAFQNLKELVMSNLGYTWSDVLKCAHMWPHIVSLQLLQNNIECLEKPPQEILHSLTFLDLSGNPLEDWNEVNKLGKLQSLQTLGLAGTLIRRIQFPGESNTPLFPSLEVLLLSNTLIDNWESINELQKLRALTALSFAETPLLGKQEERNGTGSQMIIARIEKLTMLNRFSITSTDRKGAEYDYIKRYGREWIESKNTEKEAEFIKSHPRYKLLLEKHGDIEKSEVEEKHWTLKSRIIKLNLVSPNCPDRPPFLKALPSNMSVQKLVGLTQKLFQTGRHTPTLYAISAKTPGVEVKLDKDLQGLSYFSVENGDTISVRW